MRVDMHFHTNHSDGAATVSQVLKRIRELNIGVAITDHNEISGSLEAFHKKGDKDLIIPGIEVKSIESMDVLFYFYEPKEMIRFFESEILPFRKKIPLKSWTTRRLTDIVALEKKYSCVMSIPHMYGYSFRSGRNDMFEKNEKTLSIAEIFESINGGTDKRNNLRAQKYIRTNNKKITGGSDGHSISRLGNVITEAKASSISGFLDEVKAGNVFVHGKETGKFMEVLSWLKNKIF